MTTEEIQNFNIDNDNIEIVKDFSGLGSVINSKGDCRQKKKKNQEKVETKKGSKEKIKKDHQEQRYH